MRRRCRRPSCRPMLFEKLFDLLVSCKSALARRLEASVNACKFFRRRMIFAGAEPGIDLKGKLGELSLSRFGPRFGKFQNGLEFVRCHGAVHSIERASTIGARGTALQRAQSKIIFKAHRKEISSQSPFGPAALRGARFSLGLDVVAF
jgi:hypothetical protein